MVYYNEIDPKAAAWLRQLIADGHLPAGDVDTRSIEDVTPNDLDGYIQHHFFAGIGGWARALRLAGWPGDRPIWTGSCPCQPFSSAGKGLGMDDERHLWPAWYWLIAQCRPPVIFGEQVASKNTDAWIDLVQADVEALGYAFGSVPFPAAGVGSPHIRDRNYWVGHADREGLEGYAGHGGAEGRQGSTGSAAKTGIYGGVADADSDRRIKGGEATTTARHGNPSESAGGDDRHDSAGPVNGHWRSADWLFCQDGKWRPVESDTQPLADGIPARVVRLSGYGNAIVPQAAAEFMMAYMAGES